MAIAFDSVGAVDPVGFVTNEITWSHTNAGDLLLVGTSVSKPIADDVTGVTYNSIALTRISQLEFSSYTVDWWYLLAPAIGTFDVVATAATTPTDFFGASVSYTGAQQSGVPDDDDGGGTIGTAVTRTVTTVADNCWTVLAGMAGGGGAPLTAGAGSTERGATLVGLSGTVPVFRLFDSDGAITPAGAYSMTFSCVGTQLISAAMISFAPGADVAAAVAGAYHLLLPRSRLREW